MSKLPGLLVPIILSFASAVLAASPAGHWEGAIELPNGALAVKVDLTEGADGAWSGTIDIPLQGAVGLKLTGIRAAADSLVFGIDGIPGSPTFRGAFADEAVNGDFSQHGATFPFRLGREALPPPRRPQEPQPPFPYAVEEVGYDSGAVHLAATLTLPPGKGPFPAAVLITGSGAQNRDEELFGHKPFAVLADALTRRGIAVLRADDRGVGGSTGSNRNATTSDFAADALAGVRYLRTRPEVAADRIGLVGHSEGGIVAPLAAVRAPGEVAYVVMLAGTGVPLGDVIRRQVRLISEAEGADSAAVAREAELTALVLDMVEAGTDSATVRARFAEAARAAAAADGRTLDDAEVEALAESNLAGVFSPWFRYALGLDPRDALRRLACPALVLNGELDRQVDPDQNLPEIERALAEAGNPDVTVRRLPGLNHIFQTAVTGAVSEYATIEETMSPEVLTLVGDWILARFGAR